jgi:hypothetical protein
MSGNSNTSVGSAALSYNQAGDYNTAIGTFSLFYNESSNNTAIGNRSLFANTSGSNNTAIGNGALYNGNGTNNTAIGNGSDIYNLNTPSVAIENATAIGNGAIADASNTIQLGNSAITDVKTNGAITAAGFKTAAGTSSQYLMADGTVYNGPTALTEADDEIPATSAQTSFTLTQTPASTSKVKMYINGVRISKTAYSVSGTTLTYDPSFNGNYAITASDRIQFEYTY